MARLNARWNNFAQRGQSWDSFWQDGSDGIIGSGSLVAGAAAVSGAGISASIGEGHLQAQAATLSGSGVVSGGVPGVITGSGHLVAGAATVSGAGVVSGVQTEQHGGAFDYKPPKKKLIAITGSGHLIAGAALIDGKGRVSGRSRAARENEMIIEQMAA